MVSIWGLNYFGEGVAGDGHFLKYNIFVSNILKNNINIILLLFANKFLRFPQVFCFLQYFQF